jgi:hypothetical protein
VRGEIISVRSLCEYEPRPQIAVAPSCEGIAQWFHRANKQVYDDALKRGSLQA